MWPAPWVGPATSVSAMAEYLDDAHGAAAAATWLAQGEWDNVWFSVFDICHRRWLDAEQRPDSCEVCLADTAGQKAVMANAMEPIRQNMDQEAADELGCGHPHDLLAVAGFDAVVLPAECTGLGVGSEVRHDEIPF